MSVLFYSFSMDSDKVWKRINRQKDKLLQTYYKRELKDHPDINDKFEKAIRADKIIFIPVNHPLLKRIPTGYRIVQAGKRYIFDGVISLETFNDEIEKYGFELIKDIMRHDEEVYGRDVMVTIGITLEWFQLVMKMIYPIKEDTDIGQNSLPMVICIPPSLR